MTADPSLSELYKNVYRADACLIDLEAMQRWARITGVDIRRPVNLKERLEAVVPGETGLATFAPRTFHNVKLLHLDNLSVRLFGISDEEPNSNYVLEEIDLTQLNIQDGPFLLYRIEPKRDDGRNYVYWRGARPVKQTIAALDHDPGPIGIPPIEPGPAQRYDELPHIGYVLATLAHRFVEAHRRGDTDRVNALQNLVTNLETEFPEEIKQAKRIWGVVV